MPNDINGNDTSSGLKAYAKDALIQIGKTLINEFRKEAESRITNPEKRQESIDKSVDIIKSIVTKPNVQEDFEELLREAYRKEGIDKDSVANSLNLTIRDTLQCAYMDGITNGYNITMMGLMETSAPRGLIEIQHEYFRQHFGNHMFEDRRKVYEQYKEMLKHYKENDSVL